MNNITKANARQFISGTSILALTGLVTLLGAAPAHAGIVSAERANVWISESVSSLDAAMTGYQAQVQYRQGRFQCGPNGIGRMPRTPAFNGIADEVPVMLVSNTLPPTEETASLAWRTWVHTQPTGGNRDVCVFAISTASISSESSDPADAQSHS